MFIGFALGPMSMQWMMSLPVYCLLTWSLDRLVPITTTELIINIMQVIMAAMMATNYFIEWW